MKIVNKIYYLINKLSTIVDIQSKINNIIDTARDNVLIEEKDKNPDFSIIGCQSQLWLYPTYKYGAYCNYLTNSNSIITRSIASVFANIYTAASSEEILSNKPFFLQKLGLIDYFSPNRRNGLSKIWKKISGYAEIYFLKLAKYVSFIYKK